MAAVGAVFLDTSILIGGLIETTPLQVHAQRMMDLISKGRLRQCRTAWHCCLEFYSVITRFPEDVRVPPETAIQVIEEEVFGRMEILDMPPSYRLPFLKSAALDGIIGGRVYDSLIAEIARSSKSRYVVTENRKHFSHLLRHGIHVFTAEEFCKLYD